MKTKILLNRSGMGPDGMSRKGRHSLDPILSRLCLASLICLCMLTIGSGNVWGAEEVYKETIFNSTNNSGKAGSYSNSWYNTTNSFRVNITNANNNNNGWEYVKIGSKSSALTGTFITNAIIDQKITKVSINIGAITTASVTSIKLYTSTNKSSWTERGTFTKATGWKDVTIAAANQANNYYYKIEAVCAKASSNGPLQINGIRFYKEAGGTTYTVTYNKNNASASGTMTDSNSPYASEATVTVLANGFTAPSGKVFSHWDTKADDSGTDYAPGATFSISGNTTLYAQWATAYTVTYNLNGGTGTTPTESAKASGSTFTLHDGTTGITPPTKKVFSKWRDQDGTDYEGGDTYTMPSKNVTLTAQWVTGGGDYVLVEDAEDIGPGKYLIVYNNTYALNTHYGNVNANTYGTYTDISDYYNSKKIASNATTDALAYTVAETTNGYSIKRGEYLGCTTATNTGLRWDETFEASTDEWTLGVDEVRSVAQTGRYIRWNNTSGSYRFATYTSGSCQSIQLFKQVEACEEAELAYSPATETKTYGDAAFTKTLTNSHSVAVTYALSDVSPAGCVSINTSTGQVTINGAGSATVTASSAKQTVSDVDYCADEASYTLTVNKADISPTLTYSPASVAVGENSSAPSVSGNTGSGTVTYAITSATPAGCATIDAGTGIVTGVAVGSVTVTATVAATTNYNGGSATANVTITAASNFPNGRTIFIQAGKSGSAWSDNACVVAWFHSYGGSETAQPTYWLFDVTAEGDDKGKKLFAAVVPSSGDLPYLDINRYASDCTTPWNKNGGVSYSDASGSNTIRSEGSGNDQVYWNLSGVTMELHGDPSGDEWESSLADVTDQGSGIWSGTYENYAPANVAGTSQDFKIKTNYNGWIGNTGSNNNATLDGMKVGSTYNITATLNVTTHALTMSKTFVKGTVHFDMQDHGLAISDYTNVAAGSKISAPSTPTDGSYIFGGWYKEPACTNAWDFANDVVNETMTLYAKWYQVTLVVKDDASATLSGDGKPTLTRSGASLTAATAGLYTFKDIQITSGTGTLSSTSSLTPTINSVSSNITVTATFWKPRTVTKGTGTGTSTFTLSATSVAYNGSMTITCAADATHKNPWTLTVTPSDGATYSSSGSAGSITISNITKNITVDLAYTAKSTATVKLHVAGSTSTIPGTRYEGDNYTLPTTAADCPDVSLYGWYTEDYEHATIAPSGAKFTSPGANATLVAGDNDFYAVYAEMNEIANTYTKITTTGELVTGDYLIVAYFSSSYIEAMANTVNSSDYMDEVQMKTFVNSTSNPTTINLGSDNPAIRWRITNNGNTVNFYNAAVNKYFSTGTGTPTLANSAEEFSYSVSSGRWSFVYDNTYLIYTTNYYVGNTEDKPIYLFKRDVTAGNYTTSPSCVTHDLTVVASPVAGGSAEALLTVLGEGKTTTATATPDEHYTFSYWTISGAGSSMSNTVDSKSTDNPVTVTMGTEDATLTAHFTEKEKCTVVFKNNGGIESSATYWLGENPVAPLLTDGVSNDACDATSDKHYGWTRNLITGNVADQATLDARTGSDVVYTKAATLPAITAGDDGTTITYHAVWAQATGSGSGNYELVEEDLGTEWAGDYLIAYSSTIFADGRVGGKDAGSIGAQSTHVTPGDNLSANEKVVAGSWGDTYYVTLEEISENSNTYVLKTQDDVYNYQSSNANGLASTDNKATAANYPITVNFKAANDIELALGEGAAGAIFHYNNSVLGSGGDVFRYYKNGGMQPIYLYKKMGGTTYSTFLTTCCDKNVTLATNSPAHGSITFSPEGPIGTCGADAASRQTTMTVTPDASYYLSDWSTSGVTPASLSAPISYGSVNNSGAQATTVTFTQNTTTGTYTANATFSPIPVSSLALTVKQTGQSDKVGNDLTMNCYPKEGQTGGNDPLNHTLKVNFTEVLPANALDKDVDWSVRVKATGDADWTAVGFTGNALNTNSIINSYNKNTGNLQIKATEGTAEIKITAHDGSGVTAKVTITVANVALSSLNVAKSSTTLYVGESEDIAVTYDPVNTTQKGYTTGSYSYVTISRYNDKITLTGKAATSEVMETVTLTSSDPGHKTATINVTVKPLPTVTFEDIVHNKTDFTVPGEDGDCYTAGTGVLTSTVTTGVVSHTKHTPSRAADVTAPVGGNTCETEHLHLVGWIRSDYSKVANYIAGTGDKPTISEITSAGTDGESKNYYFAAGASINVETYNGFTFYAVWAKMD